MMHGPALVELYFNCGRCFLRPLIELMQPEAVIALTQMATNGILHACGIKTYRILRNAIDLEEGLRLSEKTRLFPLYHCRNHA